MTNTYISSYRTKKRQPAQYPTDQITDQQLAASAAHRSAGLWSAEDQALATLPDPQIKAAMQALPEQFRIAVYFADVVGFSYKEIAAIMKTEQGTVSSRSTADENSCQSANRLAQPAAASGRFTSPDGAAERRPTVTDASLGDAAGGRS